MKAIWNISEETSSLKSCLNILKKPTIIKTIASFSQGSSSFLTSSEELWSRWDRCFKVGFTTQEKYCWKANPK